jgi:hypothetical protein
MSKPRDSLPWNYRRIGFYNYLDRGVPNVICGSAVLEFSLPTEINCKTKGISYNVYIFFFRSTDKSIYKDLCMSAETNHLILSSVKTLQRFWLDNALLKIKFICWGPKIKFCTELYFYFFSGKISYLHIQMFMSFYRYKKSNKELQTFENGLTASK